jgi:hypothetical protein
MCQSTLHKVLFLALILSFSQKCLMQDKPGCSYVEGLHYSGVEIWVISQPPIIRDLV